MVDLVREGRPARHIFPCSGFVSECLTSLHVLLFSAPSFLKTIPPALVRKRDAAALVECVAMKKAVYPILFFVLFEAIAVTLWLTQDNLFYLFNFSYIGICLSLGVGFYVAKKPYARRFTQFAVGLYLLVYLGLIGQENMQIEGFWYYLFLGVFEAATMHYVIAKIFGPVIFGRGFCGYACWTAMVLDLLPYKVPQAPRKKAGFVRLITLAGSFACVMLLYLIPGMDLHNAMFWAFVVGNVLYYAVGIVLAFALKDNRAFCKYACPIALLMKPGSYVALIRVRCDESKCIQCGRCLEVCPMNVEVNNDSRKRRYATECILCMECTKVCPTKALK